ncbi:MAG: helix-turn-helix domain-containing protein [Thermoplasmata archaeon]
MGQAAASLVELLAEHGVPERAARIYLLAVREGPQTASELARAAALHRVEAYRLLRQLEEAGLLRPTTGRPRRFAALPPAELIERWIRDASQRLTQLESDKERMLTDLEGDLSQVVNDDRRHYTVLDGREQVMKFLRTRIGAAHREVLMTTNGVNLAVAIDGGLDRAFREAQSRGVKVRLVADVGRNELFEAKHFAGLSDVRHAPGPVTTRVVVIDRTGALIFVTGHDGLSATGDGPIAVWSTAPAFVRHAREYHQRLWTRGQRADARIVELETPLKPVLHLTKGGAAEPSQQLRDIARLGLVATGLDRVELALPEVIEVVGRQLGRQLATRIEGDTAKAVTLALAEYYREHGRTRMAIVRDKPLTVRVTQCFACTAESPEVGRVLCPQVLRSLLEARLGSAWAVSKPDPRRHAQNGCVFQISPG